MSQRRALGQLLQLVGLRFFVVAKYLLTRQSLSSKDTLAALGLVLHVAQPQHQALRAFAFVCMVVGPEFTLPHDF